MPFSKLNEDFMTRFQKYKLGLEKTIERHLPGDFSNWEEDNTTWNGPVKTVDGTNTNPTTLACAWGIFCAFSLAEESLDHVNRQADLDALNELKKAIDAASEAFNSLSMSSTVRMNKASSNGFESFGNIPPVMLWNPLISSLLSAIPPTREYIEENHKKLSKQNWKAMAVAEECREVFSARTGRPAAKSVRDEADKKNEGNPAPLVMFIKDIFAELEINSRADSALTALRKVRN